MESDEDNELWHNIIQGVTPIKSNKMFYIGCVENNSDKKKINFPSEKGLWNNVDGSSAKNHFDNYNLETFNQVSGAFSNIDYNTKTKLDRGKYPIDNTIDLHGYSVDAAFCVLIDFITSNYHAKNKCILVITGWGRQSAGFSIIKESLHKWLNSDAVRPMILYYKQATAKHGGKGAYYILLKTKR